MAKKRMVSKAAPAAVVDRSGLVGKTIVAVRPLTARERDREGWEAWRDIPTALVLDDGTVLYPSRDSEGNGPGVFFGVGPDGKTILVMAGGA